MKPLAQPKGPSPPATAISLCSAEFGRASGGHGTACGIDHSIEERPLLLWLPESSCTLRSCLHCFQTPNVVSFFRNPMGLSENIVSLNMVYHQFPYCKFQFLRIPHFETNPSHILGQLYSYIPWISHSGWMLFSILQNFHRNSISFLHFPRCKAVQTRFSPASTLPQWRFQRRLTWPTDRCAAPGAAMWSEMFGTDSFGQHFSGVKVLL